MTNDSRPHAIAYLKSITDKEFSELVHEAVQGRCQTSDTEAERGHFVLANVSLEPDDRTWELEVVGLHDPQRYSHGFDADVPLSQLGNCAHCGFAMVSWAKHAKCSICGADVYCT